MKKALIGGLVVLAVVAIALGAGLDGRWVGTVSSPNGDMDLTFVFKTDGENVTGSVETEMGSLPISNGKLAGDALSFDVDFNGESIAHKGTFSGDKIHLSVSSSFGDWEMDLSRAQN